MTRDEEEELAAAREMHLSRALDSIEAGLRRAETLKRRLEITLGFSIALNITLFVWLVTT